MISVTEAIAAADSLQANYGVCAEYTDCYIFNVDSFDMFASPLVVMKETGECIAYPDWAGGETADDSKYIKSYKLTDAGWTDYIDPDLIEED